MERSDVGPFILSKGSPQDFLDYVLNGECTGGNDRLESIAAGSDKSDCNKEKRLDQYGLDVKRLILHARLKNVLTEQYPQCAIYSRYYFPILQC